ncbi:hypothetical protein CDV55_106631 [Aspergillus turcosus]|nr:hypothetical protein CDV55_106631 [Aspergillus turcosus]
MPNQTHDYGDLLVTLTSEYDLMWNDRGSNADDDGSFWHPKTQDEKKLRPLGSVAVGNYNDINKQQATLLVGANPNSGGRPAVASPVGYTLMWTDHGSGADNDGSFWRPNAPSGYVSLGDVVQKGYDTPPVDRVWCLRADLAADARHSDYHVWYDRHSGANQDVSVWAIEPSGTAVTGSESIPIIAGTFLSSKTYSPPANVVLAVPALQVKNNYQKFNTPVPQIGKDYIPYEGEVYNLQEQCRITLPFISFFPPTDRRALDKISDPFCAVNRSIAWYVEAVYENRTGGTIDRSETVKSGVSKEVSEEMTQKAGIQISAKYGTKLSNYGISLNYQFSYSKTSKFTEFQEHELTEKFTVPEYSATVLFGQHIWMNASRADGSAVMAQIDFNANSDMHLSGVNLT